MIITMPICNNWAGSRILAALSVDSSFWFFIWVKIRVWWNITRNIFKGKITPGFSFLNYSTGLTLSNAFNLKYAYISHVMKLYTQRLHILFCIEHQHCLAKSFMKFNHNHVYSCFWKVCFFDIYCCISSTMYLWRIFKILSVDFSCDFVLQCVS